MTPTRSQRRCCRILEKLPMLLIVVLDHYHFCIIPRTFGYSISTTSRTNNNNNAGSTSVIRQLVASMHHLNNDPVTPPAFAKCGISLDDISDSTSSALFDLWKHGPNALKMEKQQQQQPQHSTFFRGHSSSSSSMDIVDSGDDNGSDQDGEDEEERHYTIRHDLQPLIISTFESVVAAMAHYGYQTKLDRFDLFHGHMFVSSSFMDEEAENDVGGGTIIGDDCILGILFHAFEYPAVDSKILEGIDLGRGRVDSDCRPTLEEWRFRNILWMASWRTDDDDDDDDCSLSSPARRRSQGMWLLDGTHDNVANLRVDATDFGPDCPNTVWEGYLGRQIGDVIYRHGRVSCDNLAHHEWSKK